MQLFVRNKIISLGGSSTVKDAQGNDVFKVKGNIMTVTKKKRVCDMNDNVLYTVRCRWLNPLAHKAYIYDADGNKIATIKRPFMSIKQKFFVTTDQGEIMVEGGFFSMHCLIKRGEEVLGAITRQALNLASFLGEDYFMLEAADDADAAYLVALVVAIDNVVDDARGN